MSSHQKLSVVMPFYNERDNIELLLNKYERFTQKYNFELLCVNNGSTDGSEKVFIRYLRNKKYQFIKLVTIKKNIGYGYGIMAGVHKAIGEVIAWTHADMQTDPADVFRAYDNYIKQNDSMIIVKGKRKGRPLTDSIISMCMGIIATVMLRVSLYEINAQPKLFPASFVWHLTHPPNDFMLDLYFLYIAKKNRYKISTINVNFYKRLHGKSKWALSWHSRLFMIINTSKYIKYLSTS